MADECDEMDMGWMGWSSLFMLNFIKHQALKINES